MGNEKVRETTEKEESTNREIVIGTEWKGRKRTRLCREKE